jgi:hypothetical protein
VAEGSTEAKGLDCHLAKLINNKIEFDTAVEKLHMQQRHQWAAKLLDSSFCLVHSNPELTTIDLEYAEVAGYLVDLLLISEVRVSWASVSSLVGTYYCFTLSPWQCLLYPCSLVKTRSEFWRGF